MADQTVQLYNDGLYGAGLYNDPTTQARENAITNRALTPLPPPVFTGLKLQEDVIIGSLILNKIDSNNVLWICTDIEGWWSHPDPEIPDVSRGWGDGSYDASGRWAARQITLSGVILPPDGSYLPAARDTFIRQFSLVRTGAWLKTMENPPRAAWVRLSGQPSIQTVNARGRTEFSVGLRAPDPVKYSWNSTDPDGYDIVVVPCKNTSTSATGTTVINNVGNTDVTMFMEVTGPITAPATIRNVTSGTVLTIVSPLRNAATFTVTTATVSAGVATLVTTGAHSLMSGDTVTIANVNAAIDGVATVTSTPTTSSFTYDTASSNLGPVAVIGTVARPVDVLELDTYNTEVALNGVTLGARPYVDTLTDWLELGPGNNTIQFTDAGNATSTASLAIYYRSGWIG